MAKIFFLALMFCGIFIFSQSILIVIVIHAFIDIFSGLIGVQLMREMGKETKEEGERQ
jgi:hypothetical protein